MGCGWVGEEEGRVDVEEAGWMDVEEGGCGWVSGWMGEGESG